MLLILNYLYSTSKGLGELFSDYELLLNWNWDDVDIFPYYQISQCRTVQDYCFAYVNHSLPNP